MHRTPLGIPDDDLRDTVVVNIGYLNSASVEVRNRPPRDLAGNIIRVNDVPCIGTNELLIILARERGQLQIRTETGVVCSLDSMRAGVDDITTGCRDLDCWIIVHLPRDHVITTRSCNLPE